MGGPVSQALTQQTLWYLSRATGLVSMLLLTATTVLGLWHTARSSSARWPRFALHSVHRNVSLLTGCFLVVHVAGAIIDPYAGIRWVDAIVPFGSSYHPVWLGLGALALDLVLAVVATSLLRHRIGLRGWRILHLSSYALWPLAVLHGWGIGGVDSRLGWVLALDAGCALAVALALLRRMRTDHPDTAVRRAVSEDLR
jgi:uncharacterized protein YqgC (DUF456 family)